MRRRDFLRLLGGGAAAAATPAILLAEPEPVRRYWQVPRNAPVGGVRLSQDAWVGGVWQPIEGASVTFELPDGSGRVFRDDGLFGIDASPDLWRGQPVTLTPEMVREAFRPRDEPEPRIFLSAPAYHAYIKEIS